MSGHIALPGTAWTTRAVLLEVDGVLLDTAAGNAATWRWWARRVGADPDDVAHHAAGRAVADVVRHVLGRSDACQGEDRDVDTEVAAIEDRLRVLLRAANRVRGAGGLLRSLPPRRVAVVTSVSADHLEVLLRRARLRRPEIVVHAGGGLAARPDPASHLEAIERLQVAAGDCTSIEATLVGVRAAAAAGTRTVTVVPGTEVGDLGAAADVVVHQVGSLRVQPTADGLELRVVREPKRFA